MSEEPAAGTVTLFLAGDVMLGRGVDQILPTSCPPRLHEPVVESALEYVELAERAHGPVPRRVAPDYVWGDAMSELERVRPHARIVNLETSVTTSEDYEPKGINYRMHPANVAVLLAARVDCAVVANNHVLDFGERGLLETLEALRRAGIRTAGAGRDENEAEAATALQLAGARRLVIVAFGFNDSGVPPRWAAGPQRPGVGFLPDFSERSVARVARSVEAVSRPGDVVVASLHWGSNWGYEVPASHRGFAHGLIDRAGVHVVHGHSSHHPRCLEVYRGHLILYGCGDFLDDYEGIHGYEEFRGDLVLMYFPTVAVSTGTLLRLEMTPMRIRRFRLEHPPEQDVEWLRRTLDRECRRSGGGVSRRGAHRLVLT